MLKVKDVDADYKFTHLSSFSLLRLIFFHLAEDIKGIAVIIFGLINIILIFKMWRVGCNHFSHVNFVFIFILQLALQVSLLKQTMQQIAAGQLEVHLDSSKFWFTFREQAEALNEISAGLQKAVEERMSSERLKTELITNVSHDIKTPLTSIINYIDLLKKTEIENAGPAYLDILEQNLTA